jgi:hypothetical protein
MTDHINNFLNEIIVKINNEYPWATGHEKLSVANDMLPNGMGIAYVNVGDAAIAYVDVGDTYDTTIYLDSGELRVGSWGDWAEAAEAQHCEEEGVVRCGFCGEFTDHPEDTEWRDVTCEYCGRNVATAAAPEPADPDDDIPAEDRLRHVQFKTADCTYRLLLSVNTDNRLAYRLYQDDCLLFDGDDLKASPIHAIDSDDTVMALMTFLTLSPGDVDDEYFDKYTQEQLDFANGDAEYLSVYPHDFEQAKLEGRKPPRLTNLDDYEYEDDEDDDQEPPKEWRRLGVVIEGTLRPQDLIPAFAEELQELKKLGYVKSTETNKVDDLLNKSELAICRQVVSEFMRKEPDDAATLIDELQDALNEYAPPYLYFGTAEGDGACFGWWVWHHSIEEDIHADDIDRVDDLSKVGNAGIYVVVNDHGNMSLYINGHLVWSCV